MGRFYSIGDVSKIFDVSIDTLRYYDKIGLIKPRINPKNRYRYYEVEHLYLLSVVLEARYAEIPIKNINDFIKSKDLDVYYEFFDKQEKVLEEKINNLKKVKASVEANKKNIEEIKAFKNNYNIESLKEYSYRKKFLKVKIKDLITKTHCKRFSNMLDNGVEKAEYYLAYNLINNNSAIEVESGYMYIESCSANKSFLEKVKNNSEIFKEEKKFNGKFVKVKFLGNEREIAEYVSTIRSFKKSSENSILVKTKSYIPRNKDVVYFTELLIKVD